MKIPKFKIPTCPFCGRPIKKPEYLPVGFSDFEAGICECGSVYVCDVTGHNRGAAFAEALLIACAGDWDLAWDLEPEKDYKEVWIENYDLSTHSIIQEKESLGRAVKGVLCFLKLHQELQELKERTLKDLLKTVSKIEIPKVEKRKLTKKEIKNLIEKNEISKFLAYCVVEPINLNISQKLLYSPDPILRKKTAVALGEVCKKLCDIYPEKIIDFIKRLIYASADSASSAWGALEAVGEIIRNTGNRYSLFIKNLFGFLKFPEFRLSTLYALYRISEKNPEVLKKEKYLKLLNLMENGSPELQGLILLIFKNLKDFGIKSYFSKINPQDSFEFFNYKNFKYEKIFLKDIIKKIERSEKLGTEKLLEKEKEIIFKALNVPPELKPAYELCLKAHKYEIEGRYLDAVSLYEQALVIFQKYQAYKELANVLETLGDIYHLKGKVTMALKAYKACLDVCETCEDEWSTAVIIEKIVYVYREQKEYEKMLPYLYRMLEIAEKYEDAHRAARAMTGIGDVYRYKKEYSTAKEAYEIALKIYKGMKAKELAEIVEKGIKELEKELSEIQK